MNPKQTVPLAVTLAPLIAAAPGLLILGGIFALAAWAFSGDKEKQLEAAPAAPPAENTQKPAETPVFRDITAKPVEFFPVPSAPRVSTTPVTVWPVSTPPVPRSVASPAVLRPVPIVPIAKATPPATPQPAGKKIVTRTNLVTIFDNGARSLTRTAAVAELKRLGFGKTAAYSALSLDGRFSDWLHCASDGEITWKN